MFEGEVPPVTPVIARRVQQPAVVRVWTGRESEALRHALHHSVEEFARLVGVSRRTVGYWRQRGAHVRLRWEVQRLLDAVLARAEPAVADRFSRLLASSATSDLVAAATSAHADAPQGAAAGRQALVSLERGVARLWTDYQAARFQKVLGQEPRLPSPGDGG